MRVAIIGCGLIAEVHGRALKELGHDISVVVDSNPSRARTFAEKCGADRYGTDLNLALAADISSVHICTPPALHYDMVKKALISGKHVVCEKPLCLDSKEARELVLLAGDKDLVGAIDFNVRFHDSCLKAKGQVSSLDFGDICLVHGSYLQEFHTLPDSYSWRYRPELAGPMRATTEIGSHWIDLARFLTGLEIEEVSANFGMFSPKRYTRNGMMYADEHENMESIIIDSDDAAVISLRFSNGAIGSLLLSEVSHGRSNRLEIEITGKKQSVWWNSEDPYKLNSAASHTGVLSETNAFGGGFPDTFKSCFREVYADIEAGKSSAKPSYPNFSDGYINVAICSSVYDSARENSVWTRVRCV